MCHLSQYIEGKRRPRRTEREGNIESGKMGFVFQRSITILEDIMARKYQKLHPKVRQEFDCN